MTKVGTAREGDKETPVLDHRAEVHGCVSATTAGITVGCQGRAQRRWTEVGVLGCTGWSNTSATAAGITAGAAAEKQGEESRFVLQ